MFLFVFAELIIKNILESQLTSINKAQVDINDIDINYSPASIKINHIQATNPEQPMSNTLDISSVFFELSFNDLLLKKIHINDMSVSGIMFNTPRESIGSVRKTSEPEIKTETNQDFKFPDISFPDPKEILKNELLTSEKLVSALNKDIKDTRNNWNTITNDLVNKNSLDNYDKRYQNIQNNFNGNSQQKLDAAKSAKQLIKDLKQESDKIKNAQNTLTTDLSRLKNDFNTLKESPKTDIKRIKDKYSINGLDTKNIAQLFFGEQIAHWMQTARSIYARLQPYIDNKDSNEPPEPDRSAGQFIKFKETNPKPDFYASRIAIDGVTPRGKFKGSISGLTSDQTISQEPILVKVSGIDLKLRDKEELSAELNYIKENQGFSKFNYSMVRYQLNEFKLSKSASLPLTIENGLLSVNINAHLQKNKITGITKANFQKINMKKITPDNADSFSSIITSSFRSIDKFYIHSELNGSINNPKLKIKSNLDELIGSALKDSMNQHIKIFEQDLKEQINAKTKEDFDNIESKLTSLSSISTDIGKQEIILQNKIATIENKIKEQTGSKINKKLKGLKNLFK